LVRASFDKPAIHRLVHLEQLAQLVDEILDRSFRHAVEQ
jgi:hypothetical protein